MYLFKHSLAFEVLLESILQVGLAQDSSEQPDFVNKDFRYDREALSFWPNEESLILISLSFLDQEFFGLSAMNPLNSVDHSKKYSSGLSSLLTLRDSHGEMLQDSNGVLLVSVEGLVSEGMV